MLITKLHVVAAYRLTFDNFLSHFIKLGSYPHYSVEEWGQLGQGLSLISCSRPRSDHVLFAVIAAYVLAFLVKRQARR